jgi:hypothetical protein
MLIGGRALAGAALGALVSLWAPAPALACGGCFHEASPPPTPTYTPPPPSLVTDHRMVLSVSMRQTVLWDQIRYSGEPSDFAWVLPVRGGARLELARDEFIAALDASTTPIMQGPYDYDDDYVGCGLFGCAGDDSTSSSDSPGRVDVLNQSVVGPYETVTLHAADHVSLTTWLDAHQYVVPAGAGSIVQAYIDEGFDFIALRLRPQCAERAMQPVRVISPGADPTLPLRMVTAGVGAKVGITLWVISEGRLEPENFPVATIDDKDLRWSFSTQTSNYATLSETLMSGAEGRTWLVESSENAAFLEGTWSSANYRGYVTTPRIDDAYFFTCPACRPPGSDASPPIVPCPQVSERDASAADASIADAGEADADDAGEADADADAGDVDAADAGEADADAGDVDAADAGEPDADVDASSESTDAASQNPEVTSRIHPDACPAFDDLDVALAGLHRSDVWVTRLRANLPHDALVQDLRLHAGPQSTLRHVHQVDTYAPDDASPDAAPPPRHSCLCGELGGSRRRAGTWPIALAIAALAMAVGRRASRR